MSEFEELLTKTASVLEHLKIPYIVTGGAGVVFWGRPRFTADIDIAIELQVDDIVPLVKELRATLGESAYIDEAMIRKEHARHGEFNVLHPDSGLKVDFFVVGDDPLNEQELERAIVRDVQGQSVAFISPEDLILSKLRWYEKSQSEKHLEDARSVVKIQGDNLDRDYLKRMADRFGLTDLLTQVDG